MLKLFFFQEFNLLGETFFPLSYQDSSTTLTYIKNLNEFNSEMKNSLIIEEEHWIASCHWPILTLHIFVS